MVHTLSGAALFPLSWIAFLIEENNAWNDLKQTTALLTDFLTLIDVLVGFPICFCLPANTTPRKILCAHGPFRLTPPAT